MIDGDVVAVQIGRPLRAASEVVSRCPLGLPVVIAVPPLLEDGTPFPTRYWLSCPLASKRIGRIEAAGGVKAIQRFADSEEGFGSRLAAAHSRYAAERDSLVPPGSSPAPTGGVGGTKTGVKCLHAHYADTRAGNDNPVGEATLPWVEPLNCEIACVAEIDGAAANNPDWREP